MLRTFVGTSAKLASDKEIKEQIYTKVIKKRPTKILHTSQFP